MPKVILIQVVFNSRDFIPKVFPAALKQTTKDCELHAVIAGDDDGSTELIRRSYPSVMIHEPGYNIGFSRGHNELFATLDADYFQLVNPDLILHADYVAKLLAAFDDNPHLGAVSGKLLHYNFNQDRPTQLIDSTGVLMQRSGRGFDRGQHEEDRGQYDDSQQLLAVSAAGAMYSRKALEAVKMLRPDGRYEYFDEDFQSYWEDVDLAWRMSSAGFAVRYLPEAVAYHGRSVPSSPGGYRKFFSFIRHRRNINPVIRQLNYKNHIFLFIKNSPRWYLNFFAREFFYSIYVLIFETATLKVVPELFRQLPLMFAKRKQIRQTRKLSMEEMENLLL